MTKYTAKKIAKLIRKAKSNECEEIIAKALSDIYEECAQICEEVLGGSDGDYEEACETCAQAIREASAGFNVWVE